MIDAVLFDFGGVFMASPFEAIRKMGEEKGIDFDEALDILFGPYDADTDHPWHRAERGELDVASAREQIRELARARGVDIDLYDMLKHMSGDGGVREAMVACTRRVRDAGCVTAIVTNNIVEAGPLWRPILPLDELFDVVVDSSEIGVRKPDPAIFHHTLKALGGIAPARAAFLDDFAGNVVAAESVGLIGVLVELDPTAAIARVDELLAARRSE